MRDKLQRGLAPWLQVLVCLSMLITPAQAALNHRGWQNSSPTGVTSGMEPAPLSRNAGRASLQAGSISIHNNNFEGNDEYGLNSDIPINAENNWWGDASGPMHATNPGGKGDPVSDNVDFDPWLPSAVDIGVPYSPPPEPGTITVSQNSFEDNGTYGVQSSIPLNAENNWWGHPSGPYHSALNPDGQGDNVSDNVDFDPWLTTPPAPTATFAISGYVRDGSGNPISGVTVSAGTGGSAITDADGAYTISGLITGTYTLTPSKSGWTFTPATRTVSVPPSATEQNFTGNPLMPDLVNVMGLEVTQGIQCYNWPGDPDCVPLIAGKPTVVRAYVASNTGSGLTVWGTLYADDGGGPVSIGPDNAPVCAVENPDRDNDHHALRFSLPPSMWNGSPSIYVEVYTSTPGTRVRYPASGEMRLAFNSVEPLRIGYVSIDYNRQGTPDEERIATAEEYLESLYPLAEVDYFQVVSIPYYWYGDQSEKGWRTRRGRGLISHLNLLWHGYDIAGWPQPNGEPDQLFGWVPDATWELDGLSDPEWNKGDGRVAFGSDTPTNNVYQVIMAHELGHNFGQCHPICDYPPGNVCPYSGPYWPHSDYAIHDVGFDFGVYPRLNPLVTADTDDFMVGGHCGARLVDDKWISAYTFQSLYEVLSDAAQAMSLQTLHSLETITTGQPVLLVSGSVYTDATAELGAAYQLTATQAISQRSGTDYCLSLEDSSSVVLSSSCFDLSFVDPEWGIALPVASFVRVLPYDPAAVRLVLTQEADELAERIVSVNPPTVTIQAPSGGQVITGTVNVTWTAGDADGDRLSYAVSYSADGGQSWYHLGIGITDTHLMVDTGILQGSDQALFRVIASDGINTAYDVSNEVFTVPAHAPEVYILSPDDGTTLAAGQTLLLRGRGYDLENGTLPNDALSWASSLSGVLGTGRVLSISGLPVGPHVITLTAMDGDGNTAAATVNVFVGYRICLPFVLRNH